MTGQSQIFKNEKFTNLYALSKTLRFELKPIGKTLENMHKNLGFDKNLQTFLKDQKIEDAYQTLKPVLDLLHEEFINESLESDVVKEINFSDYLKKYRNKKELKEKDFEAVEKPLRDSFAKAYAETAKVWKDKAGKNEKGKEILSEQGFKILTESGILNFIKINADRFSNIVPVEELQDALSSFEGFYTYFEGFNQNRENYYETGEEATTAVATRIVHENLPKFCENIIFYETNQKSYENVYPTLEKLGRSLINKDKKELFPIKSELFEISYFSKCLSQKQIEDYNEKIGNANFLINLYNQAKKDESGFKSLSLFKTLYKQIGCGEKKSLFFALSCDRKSEKGQIKNKANGAEIVSVEDVLELAAVAGKKYFIKNDNGIIDTVPEFIDFILNRQDYSGIYWSKAALNTISNRYFSNWHDLKDKLKQEKIFEKIKIDGHEDIKIPEAIELEGLFRVFNKTENWKNNFFKPGLLEMEPKKNIIEASETPSKALLSLICSDISIHAQDFCDKLPEVLLLSEYKTDHSRETIKSWLDEALSVSQMLKYFLVKEKKAKGIIDAALSQALQTLLSKENADWFGWYDALRNYLTQKPQDGLKDNKLKLNFENSTLANGWDINKEPDNYCVILQNSHKENFLAIISKLKDRRSYNKIFEKNLSNPLFKAENGSVWKKMEYKLLPGPNKMLPKCLLPKSDRKKYGATEEVLAIYDKGSFKKNEDNFSRADLHKLIDFYKSALKTYEDWKCFDFEFKPTNEYEDISKFYSDVEKQGYKLSFEGINELELNRMTDEGEIYLFQIKNQDSNENKKSEHKSNLHTIYWNAVFRDVANRPKLNGQAEIFYRKALPKDKLKIKKNSKGQEIIENFRFSKEKFLFHVPITLNFCLKNENVNSVINQNLDDDTETYFLGIDRGEKHLAYYSLIDKNGKLIKQDTLNIPFPENKSIKVEKRSLDENGREKVEIVECRDYNELLDARAGYRDYARKNWQTIGTIKELKDGYISQVVRKIVDLATEHGAFIVLEDLNIGFKRGRQKIEKSIYQKLELALAKKLNFLVDKNAKDGQIGSVTKALQLAPPVTNYGDIENRKQFGIMLYTRADYTSQTDPVTGWRKTIYLKKASEENIKKQLADKFTDIGFDGVDYFFEYKDTNTGKSWKLYSGYGGVSLDRFRGERHTDKNQWISTKQNIVDLLDRLFRDFDKSRSLLSQILEEKIQLTKVNEKHTPFESLRFVIEMIQQIRNTGIEKVDNDFILSPVRDEHGKHFDSRKAMEGQPDSGDANGAYNIARKGLIMSEHIKQGWKLYINDLEWDAWLAGHDVWEKWTKINEKILVRKKDE